MLFAISFLRGCFLMNKCYTHYGNIGAFLRNINGNWRNSMYVACTVCKYQKENCCSDLLVSFGADGVPAVIMVTDANFLFGTIIDKTECLCEISNAKFRWLFENYLQRHADSNASLCPFLQLTKWEKFP